MFRCQSISRSFFKSALQVSFCFSRLGLILPFEQFRLFLFCESDMDKRPCGQFMQKTILQPSEGSFFFREFEKQCDALAELRHASPCMRAHTWSTCCIVWANLCSLHTADIHF